MEPRPPLPPFTEETARQKIRLAEDAWNSKDPERVAEEAKGRIRWLRPEYQQKGDEQPRGKQAELEVEDEGAPAVAAALQPWPEELPAQAAALNAVLAGLTAPADVDTIDSSFEGKRTKKRLKEVTRLLETLAALGRARKSGVGWTGA